MFNILLHKRMKKISVNYYRRIYYCFQLWHLILDSDPPKIAAVVTMTTMGVINLLTIYIVLYKISKHIYLIKSNDYIYLVIFSTIYLALNYWFLASFGRLERIQSIIENEDAGKKKKWKYITILYVTITLVALFTTFIIRF